MTDTNMTIEEIKAAVETAKTETTWLNNRAIAEALGVERPGAFVGTVEDFWTKVSTYISATVSAPADEAHEEAPVPPPVAKSKSAKHAASKQVDIRRTAEDYDYDPFAAPTSRNFLRMALIGPSGTGKTYTSLRIASEYKKNAKIALVDTEHGSAGKYRNLFDFKHFIMEAPYHPQRAIDLLHAAEKFGYDFLILDSLSHYWTSEGGVLDIRDAVARQNSKFDSFGAWREATPIHNAFVEAILGAQCHIISTIRAKTAYEVQKDSSGNTKVVKLGLEPVQRAGLEYDYDVVGDLVDGEFIATKTRCPALKDKAFKYPGADVATILREWLEA